MTSTRWASEGAVRQEGSLKIHECRKCGRDFVWRTSRKTGKVYKAVVQVGVRVTYYTGQPHQCTSTLVEEARAGAAEVHEQGMQAILMAMTPEQQDAWIAAEIERRKGEQA